MRNVAKQTGLLAGMVLAILSAFATAGLAFIPNSAGLILLVLPGLFLAGATGIRNSLAVWVAASANLCFWFLLCWLIGILIGKIGWPRNTSEVP
jgi:hypothetical protein